MPLPEGYALRASHADHDEHPDWALVEHVCMQTDEVYVDPHQHHIGTLIDSPDGDVVGAMWYSFEHENTFSFHLATSPQHRDIGLGSFMIDEAVRIYHQLKQDNPALQAGIYVVEPKVMQALLNRGFCVSGRLSLDENQFSAELTEAPPLETFLQSAMQQDAKQFFEALNTAPLPATVPPKLWPSIVKTWFKQPFPLEAGTQEALQHFVLALPLSSIEQRYLWSQLQNHVGSKAPFPHPLLSQSSSGNEPEYIALLEPEGFRVAPR